MSKKKPAATKRLIATAKKSLLTERGKARIAAKVKAMKPMGTAGLREIVDTAPSLRRAKDDAYDAVQRQMSRTEHGKMSSQMQDRLMRGIEFAYENRNNVRRD